MARAEARKQVVQQLADLAEEAARRGVKNLLLFGSAVYSAYPRDYDFAVRSKEDYDIVQQLCLDTEVPFDLLLETKTRDTPKILIVTNGIPSCCALPLTMANALIQARMREVRDLLIKKFEAVEKGLAASEELGNQMYALAYGGMWDDVERIFKVVIEWKGGHITHGENYYHVLLQEMERLGFIVEVEWIELLNFRHKIKYIVPQQSYEELGAEARVHAQKFLHQIDTLVERVLEETKQIKQDAGPTQTIDPPGPAQGVDRVVRLEELRDNPVAKPAFKASRVAGYCGLYQMGRCPSPCGLKPRRKHLCAKCGGPHPRKDCVE